MFNKGAWPAAIGTGVCLRGGFFIGRIYRNAGAGCTSTGISPGVGLGVVVVFEEGPKPCGPAGLCVGDGGWPGGG